MLANGQTGQLDFRLNVGTTGGELDVVRPARAPCWSTRRPESPARSTSETSRWSRSLTSTGWPRVLWTSLGTAADPSAAIQVLPGPEGTFYVVHRQSGRIDVNNPVSGQTVATQEVGTGLSPAIVSGNGALWAERQQTGAMVGVDYQHGSLHVQQVRSSVVAPGDDVRLSSVNGIPAVLDQTRGLFFLAPGGVPGTAVSLPRATARHAVVAPTLGGSVVPLAVPGKVILIQIRVASVVDLNGRAGDQLGAPIPFAQRILRARSLRRQRGRAERPR